MQRKHSYHKKTPQTEDGVFLEEEGPTSKVSYGCNKRGGASCDTSRRWNSCACELVVDREIME